MKRIFLTGFIALSIFAVQAQTKTGSKKSKKTHVSSTDAKMKAKLAKQEAERQQMIEEQRVELLRSDSVRRDNERLADEKFQTTQSSWKDSMNKNMDSTYNARYKSISTQQAQWAQLERNRDLINKAAKLSDYQGRQVKSINQTYTDKAKLVNDNVALTADQKKEQLISLNTERRAKIKAVLGSGKEKKLEKERKEFVQKNGTDVEESWIDQVEGYAKNN